MRTVPVVLVIERQPYWGPECARQLMGIAEVETCAPEDDWNPRLETAPAVIVLEAAALPSSAAYGVARLCRSRAAVLAIVPAGNESMEWWLRELGVRAVYRDDHSRDEVLETCRKLLRP